MEGESVLNYILIGLGIIALIASFFNWNWVFRRQEKAGFFKLLDRNGARVFNFMLGLLMLIVGAFDFVFPLID